MPMIGINTQILHLVGSKTSLWHLISFNLQSPEENSRRISLLYFLPVFAACREQEQEAVQWSECFELYFLLNANWYLCTEDLHSPALLMVGKQRCLSREKLWGLLTQTPVFVYLDSYVLCSSLNCSAAPWNALVMRFWLFFFLFVTSLLSHFLHDMKEKGQWKFLEYMHAWFSVSWLVSFCLAVAWSEF